MFSIDPLLWDFFWSASCVVTVGFCLIDQMVTKTLRLTAVNNQVASAVANSLATGNASVIKRGFPCHF